MQSYSNIYAPWRSHYFTEKTDGCVFCAISQNTQDDFKNKIFYRDEICFAVMNLYPYNPGHFMIIPHKHVDTPSLLNEKEWSSISILSKKAISLLEEFGALGVNFGINIKSAAGAGIPNHLHLHFVPRFNNDTNFITSIGGARVYGMEFDFIFDKISKLSLKHFKGIQ